MKKLLLGLFVILGFQFVSQTVNCPSNLIYLQTTTLSVYDPNLPISASNPASTGIPSGGGSGLALCNNLNGSSVSPTFYTIIGGVYNYWNGSGWVSTGHTPGNVSAVNLSGAGCFIYNLVGGTGEVYKYTGTGNGTLLMTEPAFAGGGPYDISSDFDGNFYLLRTATPQWLRMYDFTGTLINTYTLNGMPNITAGGGFAVMGNTVYANNTGGFWAGIISGSVVTFTNTTTTSTLSAGDYANCPTLNTGTINYGISNTGPMGCSGGTVSVMATGFPPSATYSWAGPGLAGPPTSSSVPVNAPGIYNCTITPSSGCKTVLSTSVQSSGAVNITVTPTSTTICQGSSVNLTAMGASNYNWSGPALSSTTGSVVTANPMFSSSYVVSGSTGTCSSSPQTVVVNVTTCTGINELNNGIFGLNVYPNPNNGDFTIKASQEIDLRVVNELGQIVIQAGLNKQNNFEVNVSDLNSGVYFITDSNGRALKDKIVVIRN